MDAITKRFLDFYEYLCREKIVQNTKEFALNVGISPSLITEFRGERSKVGFKSIQKSVFLYNLNADWLITGDGNMIKGELQSKETPLVPDKQIICNSESIIQIPVFDASFAAGLSGCINGTKPDVEEYLAIPQTMLKKGAVYAGIRSKGQSMSPTIFDSDRLIVRLLDKSEWMDMRDEHVYAIIDNESRGFLKRVKNRFAQGFIVCMSDNIDKINYPNFTMQADEVVGIWHADLHISALMPNINETYYSRLKRLEDKVDVLSNKLL